jgi:hypothetical protein
MTRRTSNVSCSETVGSGVGSAHALSLINITETTRPEPN